MHSKLEQKLKNKEFVITAEIVPAPTTDKAWVLDEVAPIAAGVDAVNITDGAGARATLSSLATCAVLAANGIEPIMQLTCRDRNRIALVGDLLGASTLGIQNILTLTGDDPGKGDEPDAKPVFDLNSSQLLQTARDMRDKGQLPSGRAILNPPHFFLGATAVPSDPGPNWSVGAVVAKASAGAQFIQTQFCYDVELTKRYMAKLVDDGVTDKLKFILGVGPLRSAKSAQWMNDNLFGVSVPASVIQRLEDSADPAVEGQILCAELIEAYRDLEGVAGVHIMAPAQKATAIAGVLDRL